MAIREEHDFLSENERAFLFDAIHNRPHVRADGRELMQQRKVRAVTPRSNACGRTQVVGHKCADASTVLTLDDSWRSCVCRSACSSGEQRSRLRQKCSSVARGTAAVLIVFRVACPPDSALAAASVRSTHARLVNRCCSVIAIVHGEIVPPFPDRPTEGFLHFNVELSPMASQNFEVGRPSPMAVELARIVDRGIRECRALDTEALAIVAGEKVWAITCTIHVVDHGGNLIDCVSLAAIAAMMHYRRPEVSVQNNATVVYNIDEHAAVPLSLHHIPISISFCFIERRDSAGVDDDAGPIIFMDPTDREERITDGSMTFTFNSFRELCAVHKIGGAAISTTDVLQCANVAAARVSELTELLKSEAEKADKIAIDQRRAFLRGRDFADVSSLSAADDATRQLHRTQVDLGAMTDFGTLHAPIALRDDPSAEETDAKVTSMAELLESLETAAESAEPDATPSTSGLAMSDDDARDEFQKLSASLSLRALVAGAKTAAAPTSAPDASATESTTASKAKKTKTTTTTTKKKVEESDSEEESVVVQSEFDHAAAAPAVTPAAPTKAAKPAKKPKKKAASSDDDSEEEDLSAAIKRKPRK